MTSGNPMSDGLYFGREIRLNQEDKPIGVGDRLVYQRDRHAILFGATGSGKTRRVLMPNLLGDYLKGVSTVVIDPKGELAAVCALFRHEMHGPGSVKILDPFGKLREMVGNRPDWARLEQLGLIESAGFNPLRALDPNSPYFFDDAAVLAEALIETDSSREAHWPESAQGLMTGLTMWEVILASSQRRTPSLFNVRRMLTGSLQLDKPGDKTSGFETCIGKICEACRRPDSPGRPRIPYAEQILSLIGRFAESSREMTSIQSTADTQTRWMLSPLVAADMTRKSGVDFRDLKTKPLSVFLILPAERMHTHRVWLRLAIVSALRALYRAGGLRTVFLLDEMSALGYLRPIEEAFGLVRGYKVQILGVLQDLPQLKDTYQRRWSSLLANSGVVASFAANDADTAEWLSKRSGMTTIVARSVGFSSGGQGSGSSGSASENYSQSQRSYILPHSFYGLEEGSGVLWYAGLDRTARFYADFYKELVNYHARALKNPYD